MLEFDEAEKKALADVIYLKFFQDDYLAFKPEFHKAVREGLEKFLSTLNEESYATLMEQYAENISEYLGEEV